MFIVVKSVNHPSPRLLPQACQLPLFSYIVERLCACCYEQAWYAKLGGVVSIKFLMERLPLIWVLQNQLTFLKALLFVMMDLTGEVRGNDWIICHFVNIVNE